MYLTVVLLTAWFVVALVVPAGIAAGLALYLGLNRAMEAYLNEH